MELEDYTEKLELNQKNLLDRIEFLEGQSRNPSVHVRSQQAFSASLVAQLSDIEANVREFTGRVDEADHKVSILNNKVDTESFRTRVLLERLVKLERQIAKLNIKGSTPKLGKKEKTPGSTQLLKPKRKKKSTSLSPKEAYNLAYNDYLKGNYPFAISAFNAFIKQYPKSVLIPQAYYWKGESFYSQQSYWKAIKEFKLVISNYPESEKISKALLKVGFAYFDLDKPVKGKDFLKKVLNQFPNSNEAFLAEDKLASLK